MMRKYRILVLLLCLWVVAIQTAYAADTTSVPWDSAMEKIVNAIQITARPVVSIMIAITGLMVMFGSAEGQISTLFRIVLGLGIVLQVADLINGNHSQFAALRDIAAGTATKPAPPTLTFNAADKGINFIGNFMTYYENICIYGAAMLAPYALKVLGFLTIIEITMTMMFKLEGDHIKYLLHQIIKVGFFIFLIQNWIGGTGALMNVANTIFTSFEQLGILAAGAEEMKPENILVNAYQVISTVQGSLLSSALSGNISMILFGNFIGLVVFICIVITALQLVITRLEFWTIAMIIVPLIPFGAYTHTRFLFEKAIGAVFNLGIKMGIVSFICIVAGPLIGGMVNQLDSSWTASAMGSNFVLLLQIFVGTLLLAVLSWKVPSLAAGLLNGQPSLSSGDMLAPAKAAASTVNTTARVAGAASQAHSMSKATGATGLEKYGGSLKNLAMIANQSMNPISKGYKTGVDDANNVMRRKMTASERQPTRQSYEQNKSNGPTMKWQNIPDEKESSNQGNLKDANIKNKK